MYLFTYLNIKRVWTQLYMHWHNAIHSILIIFNYLNSVEISEHLGMAMCIRNSI